MTMARIATPRARSSASRRKRVGMAMSTCLRIRASSSRWPTRRSGASD